MSVIAQYNSREKFVFYIRFVLFKFMNGLREITNNDLYYIVTVITTINVNCAKLMRT